MTADGRLLTDVYLFDQNGRLLVAPDWSRLALLEGRDFGPGYSRGLFPRDYIDEFGNPVSSADRAREVLPPFVVLPTPQPTSQPTPQPTPGPTEAAPTPEPSPTPTEAASPTP